MLIIFIGAISQSKLKGNTRTKAFTLLIPAKDEAQNISRCLDAILDQDYDLNEVEIIVLDDNSSDDTISNAQEYQSKFPSFRVHSVDQRTSLHGKANAVNEGIKLATQEIILICDADCAPNPKLFQMLISQFSEKVGVVGGITLLNEKLIKNKLFGILQNVDWVFLLGTGSGAAGAGFPISCIGSSLAFRKKAYYDVGGYEKIPFSITEDLALYKTIARKTDWEFRAPLNPEAINWSIPMTDFNSFYRQRKRWLFGSFDLNFFGGITLAAAVLMHIFPLIHFIIYPNSSLSLYAILTVFSIDFISISASLIFLNQKKYIVFLPLYFLYYLFNSIMMQYVLLFDRKVKWKNRSYSKKGLIK